MTGILKYNGQSENFQTIFVNGIHEVSHFMNHIMKENCANQWSFSQEIFVITVKGLEHANSCVRDQDATPTPARHV